MKDFEKREDDFDISQYVKEEWLLSNGEAMKELSQFYSAFSNPTRRKILLVLLNGDKCVGKIAEVLQTDSRLFRLISKF